MTSVIQNTTINGLISTLSLQTNGVNPVGDSNPVFESFKLLPGITFINLPRGKSNETQKKRENNPKKKLSFFLKNLLR